MIIGQEVAVFATRHLPDLLKQNPGFKSGDYGTALSQSFLRIDELLRSPNGKKEIAEISAEIHRKNNQYEEQVGEDIALNVGCTACAAIITKTEIYVANTGDSRCVLSKNGIAVPLSVDHKPELENEKKRIEGAGGYIEDGRVNGMLNLSRTLGDLEYKQNGKLTPEKQIITAVPEIRIEKIGPDTEFLIIACDGIWDCFKNQDAVRYFRGKIWNEAKKKPVKTKLSKVVSDSLDSILAVDVNNEGIFMHE